MKTLGLLMMAAAAAGTVAKADGLNKPHALNTLFRPHVVHHGPPPASGPIMAPPVDPGLGAAAFGAPRAFANTTSQVFFVDPPNMQIGWQTPGPDGSPTYLPAQLTVPARYNFKQGFIYRLKLTNIAENPGLTLYPTIEVAPSTPQTDAYLAHNPIPVQFTQEDFDQIRAGNFVTKVVYLPDPKFQELAVAGLYGAETLVSTRLEPGVDPILEADKRGTILMVIRCGAIDLEMPEAVPGGVIYDAPSVTTPSPDAMVPPAAPMMAPPAEEVPMEAPVSPAEPGIPSTSLMPTEPGISPVSVSFPTSDAESLPPVVGEQPAP
ncbi:hypothetical protein [Tautonia sociabilis]|uniref:Uncharacterized protein n=1 Tax=Tautonia sociabilis TaxID=2080755 RepID=A0A432MPA7_9BACT|nr:hypothetical protein [Tautonia sociabilis]RUL89242.1 hypothetical protein TsocGM_02145 [Tautonia sociabilis]